MVVFVAGTCVTQEDLIALNGEIEFVEVSNTNRINTSLNSNLMQNINMGAYRQYTNLMC